MVFDLFKFFSESLKIRHSLIGVGLLQALSFAPSWGYAAPAQPVIAPPPTTLPTNGQVAAGFANIAKSGNTLNINQSSQNAVINWGSFNVGSQAQVNFNQPNAQAATLNRVQSASPSMINGVVHANGQIAIVNSNGIVFGKSAQVDASGIVASTLDVSDQQFMAGGNKTFRGSANSQAKVVNRGSLTAKGANAYIALLAPEVRNEGVIVAQAMTNPAVALASGSQITLSFSGNQLINVKVDASVYKSLIDNKRLIQAEGGTIVIAANAASNLMASVVKNSGVITASSISKDGGSIQLVGSKIEQIGQVLANSDQSKAGNISLTGESISLEASSVTQAIGSNQSGVIRINGLPQSSINIAGQVQASGATLLNLPSHLGAKSIGSSTTNNTIETTQIQNYLSQLNLTSVLSHGAQINIEKNASIQSPVIASSSSSLLISGVLSTALSVPQSGNNATIATFKAMPSSYNTTDSTSPWIALFGGSMIVNGRISASVVSSSGNSTNGGRVQLNVQDQLLLSVSGQVLANGADGGQVILRSENGNLMVQGLIQTNGSSGRGGTILAYGYSFTNIDGATLSADGIAQGGVIRMGIDQPDLVNRAYLLTNNNGAGSTQGPPILSQLTGIGNNARLSTLASQPALSNQGNSLQSNFIELSGKAVNIGQFHIASNPTSIGGYFLIDPTDINIDSSLASQIVSLIAQGYSVAVQASNSITVNAPIAFNSTIYSLYTPINTNVIGGTNTSQNGIAIPTFTLDITSGTETSVINVNQSITNIGINPINVNIFANGGSININAPINLNTSNVNLYRSGSLNINNALGGGLSSDQLTVNHGVAINAALTANDIAIFGYRTDNISNIGGNNANTYRGVYIAPNVSITAIGVNPTINKYSIQIIGETTDASALSTDHNAVYISSGVTINNNSTGYFDGFNNWSGIVSIAAYTGNLYIAPTASINSIATAGEVDFIATGPFAQILAGGSTINQASNKGIYMATSSSGNLLVPNINNSGAAAITNNIVLAAGAHADVNSILIAQGIVNASQVTSFTNSNGKLFLFAGDPGDSTHNYGLGKLGFGTSVSPALNNYNTYFGQAYNTGNVPADNLIQFGIFNGNINVPTGAFGANSGNVAAMFRIQPTYNMTFTPGSSMTKVYGSVDPSFQSYINANLTSVDGSGNIVIPFGAISYTISKSDFGAALTGTRVSGEDVGTYGYSALSNLNLILNAPSLSLQITPAPLTISGTKVFDGTTLFNASTLTVAGDVNGELIQVSSGSINSSSANVSSTPYTPSSSGLSFAVTGGNALISNYAITSLASVTIIPATLTVTATDDAKSYYSTSTITNHINYTNGSASQVSNGYTLSSPNYSGTAALTSFVQKVDLASTGAQLTAFTGTYDITPSNAVGNGISNFVINYVNGTLAVTPIALVITAQNDNKVYGQTQTTTNTVQYTSGVATVSANKGYSITGLKGSDSVGQLTLTSDGGLSTSSTGVYAITPGGAIGTGLSNYTISYVPAASGLLITPASLIIQANDHTTVNANPVTYGSGRTLVTTDFKATGLVGSDSISSVQINYNNQSASVPATTNVGMYINSLFPSNASGVGLSNYSITYVKGNLEVTPAALTITASPQTTVYGPAWNHGYFDFTVSGLKNNDAVNRVILTAAMNGGVTTAPANTAVGSYNLTPSAASGNGLSNYTISYVNSTFTITKATLTLTPNSVTRSYNGANLDGSSNQAYSLSTSNYALTGFVTGDSASSVALNLAGRMAFDGSTSQSVSNVGTYAYTQGTLNPTLTGANANNYQIQFATGNNYVITPKQLTVTANKTYDSTASFNPSQIALSGLVGNETLNLTGTGLGNSANVIGITSMSTSGLSLGNGTNGGLGSNYSLPAITSSASITPASLTASITNNPTKTYDGSPVATLASANFSLTGFIGSETASINQTTGLYTSPNVNGTNGSPVSAILTAANYTAGSGFVASNYLLPLSATGTGTIIPANLTITAYPSWKYLGNTDPTFTYYVTGGINGSNPVTSATVTRTNAATHNAAGQFLNALVPSSAQGTGLSNYNISYVKNTFTIVDLNQVVITSGSNSMVYGATTPAAPSSGGQYCTAQPCTGGNVKSFVMASSTGTSSSLLSPTLWTGTDTSGGGGTITYNIGLSNSIALSTTNHFKVGVYGYQVDPSPPTVTPTILNNNINKTLVTLDENTQNSSTSNSFSGFHQFLGTITVTPATITPTANPISKVYDGTVYASPSLAIGGVVSKSGKTDVVNLNSPYSAFSAKDVGTTNYTATGLYLSGADAGNYILSSLTATNASSSITPAPILVAGLVAQDKVYNGTNYEPSINGASTSRLITPFKGDVVNLASSTDSVACAGSADCSFASRYVGNNITVSVTQTLLQNQFQLSGTDAKNYYISGIAVALAANITPAPLYVSGLTANNKIYDATTAATISLGTLTVTGTVYPGDGSITANGVVTSGSFSSKNVGNSIRVNPNLSALSLSGNGASNYYIAGTSTPLTANITPAPLAVTGLTANNKVYDATNIAYITNGTLGLSGFKGSDVLTVKGKATAGTFADPNVANGINVTPDLSGLNILGSSLSNYCLAGLNGCSGTQQTLIANITPALVQLSGTVQYNGSTQFTDLSKIAISGVAGQTLTGASGYAVMDNSNVRIGKTFTDLSNLVLGNGSGLANNYTLTNASFGVVNITPAPITISATNSVKVFDGTTSTTSCTTCPSLTLVFGTLFVNVSNSNTQDTLSTTSLTYNYDNRNVGDANKSLFASGYAITDGNNGANYTITFTPNTTSTITPKALTITPNNLTKTYATNDPALTYSVSGLVPSDTQSSAITGGLLRAGTFAPGYSNSIASEQIGTYTISQGTLAASNYTINFVSGKTLTINPYASSLIMTPANQTKVYGTADPTLTYTVSGYVQNTTIDHVLINDDPTTFLTGYLLRTGTSAPNVSTAVSSENVGTYTIGKGTLAAAGYTIQLASANLKITPAPLAVKVNGHTKVYGDSDPTLTYTYTGAINRVVDGVLLNDTTSNLVGGSLARVAGENVGQYTINQGTVKNISTSNPGKNYSVKSFTSNIFTITPAVLTIAVDDNAKFAYQPDPSPLTSLSYSGFKRGETLNTIAGFTAPSLYRQSGDQPGVYSIDAYGASATNYTIKYQYTNTPTSFANCGNSNCSKFSILGSGSINVALMPISYVYGTSSTNLILANTLQVAPIALFCNYPCNSASDVKNITLTNSGLNSFTGAVSGQSSSTISGTSTFSFSLASSYDSSSYANRVVGQYQIFASKVTVQTYDSSTPPNPLTLVTTNYPNTSNITYTNGAFSTFTLIPKFLNITPLPIAVTASNAVKVYDGSTQATTGGNTLMTSTPTPVLTGATTTLPFGDQITSLNYVYTDSNVGAGNKVVQVSNVQMANGAINPLSNYVVTYVNNTTSTITPRPVTINGDAQTKTYGTNDPSLTYTTPASGLGTGVAPGDFLASIVAGALTRDSFGTLQGEFIGTYGINQGALASNSNYALTYIPGTLTLTPASIAVVANPINKVYGSNDPTLTYQVIGAVNAIINGVAIITNPNSLVSGSLLRNSGENVGQYTINQGSIVSSSQNYTLSSYTSNTFTISPLPIQVTASDAIKVYDAVTLATTGGNTVMTTTPTPVLTGTLKTLPFGDKLNSVYSVYSDPNVGSSNKVLQVSSAVLSNSTNTSNVNSNYIISYVNNTTSTITPRPITINGDNQNKAFGSNDPGLTYSAVPSSIGKGLAPGESLASVISGALSRDKYGTVPGEYVGQYAINQGTLASNSNYALTYVPSALNIGPYQGALTVVANPIVTSYGQALPPYTYNFSTPIGNVVNVDGVRLDLASIIFTGGLTATLPSSYSSSNNLPVGSYPITQGTLQTTSFTNLTYIPSTATVNPLPIYLNGLVGQSKNFDGTTKATVTGSINISGLLSPDSVKTSSSSFSTSYQFATAAPGTNILISPTTPFSQLVTALSLTGVDAKNYYIAGYSFPLSAEIHAVPDQGAMGVIIAGGIFSNSEYASGGYNPPSTLMIAYSHIPGVPKLLFPDQSNFINKTRLFPFDNTKPMDLGIKVGTAYDTINPMDYKVIPDIYEMKINSGDTNSSQR